MAKDNQHPVNERCISVYLIVEPIKVAECLQVFAREAEAKSFT